MRVGIVALLHESNTFISQPTTWQHFERDMLLEGEAIRESLAAAHHEVGGFFAGLDEQRIEAVPLLAARAVPYGTIDADAFSQILERLFSRVAEAGPLDGMLAAVHGATVSQSHADADGYWLSQLRTRLPAGAPLIATLDPHANLSRQMVAACDALIAYHTNPHLDQRQRGVDAAAMMAGTLRGEIRPTMAAAFPPMAISIQCQRTDQPPCLPLFQQAEQLAESPGVLSHNILLGFPYADVPEMGSSVLFVTNDDRELGERLANQVALSLWNDRELFLGEFLDIPQALELARKLSGPVGLLDMGDNVGGGSPGDGTLLAWALMRQQLGPAVVSLCDPAAATRAANAGRGARLRLQIGGKTDSLHGAPLDAEFTVDGLYDGKFEEPEPRHGGWTHYDQGLTAVVRTDGGLTVLVSSRRIPPFSLRQLTSCQLDPAHFAYLVAKGVNAPLAAYAPVCRHFVQVNTPGVTCADMRQLSYQNRRRPMFPFEPDAEFGEAG